MQSSVVVCLARRKAELFLSNWYIFYPALPGGPSSRGLGEADGMASVFSASSQRRSRVWWYEGGQSCF